MTAVLVRFEWHGGCPGSETGPRLSGTGIVTSSSGDAMFEADYPVGGTFGIANIAMCRIRWVSIQRKKVGPTSRMPPRLPIFDISFAHASVPGYVIPLPTSLLSPGALRG